MVDILKIIRSIWQLAFPVAMPVERIFAAANPTQIYFSVVAFIAVDMVANFPFARYTKKGKRANTMSKYIFSVDIYSQIWVASGIGFDW